jgi:hypothetical protein
LPKAADIKQSAVFNCRILTTLIRVNDCSFAYQTLRARLMENVNYKLCRHIRRNFPPDNAAREFILQTSQITKRAARQPQISNVTDQYFTLCCRRAGSILQKIGANGQTVSGISRLPLKRAWLNCSQTFLPHHVSDGGASDLQTRRNSPPSIPAAIEKETFLDAGDTPALLKGLPAGVKIICRPLNLHYPA